MNRYRSLLRSIVAIGLLVVVAASCLPAAAASRPLDDGYATVSHKGWAMTVPTAWETYRAGGPDTPFSVFVAYPKDVADSTRKPVSMQVLRFPRQGPDFGSASFELRSDPWCSLHCDEVTV